MQAYGSCIQKRFILTCRCYVDDNTYDRTIKIDVKSGSFAKCSVDSNAKNAKVKMGDRVRISKYKNIFAKVYTSNYSEEVFVINKVKKFRAMDIRY